MPASPRAASRVSCQASSSSAEYSWRIFSGNSRSRAVPQVPVRKLPGSWVRTASNCGFRRLTIKEARSARRVLSMVPLAKSRTAYLSTAWKLPSYAFHWEFSALALFSRPALKPSGFWGMPAKSRVFQGIVKTACQRLSSRKLVTVQSPFQSPWVFQGSPGTLCLISPSKRLPLELAAKCQARLRSGADRKSSRQSSLKTAASGPLSSTLATKACRELICARKPTYRFCWSKVSFRSVCSAAGSAVTQM